MSEGGRDDGDDEKMWKEAVARFVSPESGKQVHVGALNAVLVGVHRRALKLAALVEMLGPSLTGRDEGERARGSLLLGEVLSRLPSLPLAPHDLQFLGDFLTVRLLDTACLAEVLHGLRGLAKYHVLEEEQVHGLLDSLFENVHAPSLRHSARRCLFELLCLLTERSPAAIIAYGSRFSVGLVQAMDGEKDPRCLALALRLVEHCLKRVPGTLRMAEDVFELLAVYFPVSFTPREGDPVTPAVLAELLDACFSAHPAVARLAVPFLLDQLSSSHQHDEEKPNKHKNCPSNDHQHHHGHDGEHEPELITADHAVRSLVRCARAFGHRALSPHFALIWQTIKRLLLTALHDAHITRATALLSQLIQALSYNNNNNNNNIHVPSSLTDDHDNDHDHDHDAIDVDQIPVQQHTVALTRFLEPIVADCRRLLLEETEDPVTASIASRLLSEVLPRASPLAATLALPAVLDDLPAALLQPNASAASQEVCLMTMSDYLTNILSSSSTSSAAVIILPPTSQQRLLSSFSHFADRFPQALHGLAALLRASQLGIATLTTAEERRVVEQLSSSVCQADNPTLQLVALTALCSLLPEHALLVQELTVPMLLDFDRSAELLPPRRAWADQVFAALGRCRPLFPPLSDYLRRQQRYGPLLAIVEALAEEQPDMMDELVESVAIPLYSSTPGCKETIQISTAIFKACSPAHQAPMLSLLLQRQELTTLDLFLICAIKRSNIGQAQGVIDPLFELLHGDAPSHTLVCATLATLANKLPSADLPSSLLAAPRLAVIEQIPELLCWVTRALYMRAYHPTATILMEALCNMVAGNDDGDQRAASSAAKAFRKVFSSTDLILDCANDVLQSPVHKQRIFHQVVPRFRALLEQASTPAETRARVLAALAPVLAGVSRSVLVEELPAVTVIIARSLGLVHSAGDCSQHVDTILATLGLVRQLDLPQLVAEHLQTFIPLLLSLAAFQPSMQVRMDALQLLTQLASMPFHAIYPHRRLVSKRLEVPLDDPKRLVRLAAASCRNAWATIVE
ncbi:MAG: hypothetical protein Q8P67_25330 [archaeon]|nr:hypothetical protein [archaeon]